MIYVTIERQSPEQTDITAFVVEGHAEYDVPGKDLVCAAVSAVTVGACNAVEQLTGIIPLHEMDKGLLDITLPPLPEEKRKPVQLLLEGMLVMLQTIEQSYGEYITIETIYSKGG
ncbi:ribosomal-processing cysteine protease Prp [Paenibacillus athensensis]|uniref:Ribosomal processing cysteine protease Prp n=1 Tax=Paenibacillus athensensis TaxID=1967502 RepID=A0A4Y8PV50_9BACL|nr:ribosomal-processing cysteine protease Prp [Paenibacillus athensensis]MCD1258217.1 ribosomal-processing cysteine protease Prp [Paenibacillus athensensis]